MSRSGCARTRRFRESGEPSQPRKTYRRPANAAFMWCLSRFAITLLKLAGNLLQGSGIQQIRGRQPRAAGHADAEVEVSQARGRVSVGVDHDLHPFLPGPAAVHGVKIEPVRIGVDLDHRPGLRRRVDHRVKIHRVAVAGRSNRPVGCPSIVTLGLDTARMIRCVISVTRNPEIENARWPPRSRIPSSNSSGKSSVPSARMSHSVPLNRRNLPPNYLLSASISGPLLLHPLDRKPVLHTARPRMIGDSQVRRPAAGRLGHLVRAVASPSLQSVWQ